MLVFFFFSFITFILIHRFQKMDVLYRLLTVRNRESDAVWVTTEKEGTKYWFKTFCTARICRS